MSRQSDITQIGVLTGGGDCPGLNAVIRAVFRAASYHYNAQTIGILDGYCGLINKKTKVLSYRDTRDILPLGGTILGTTNRDNPFKYTVKTNGGIEYQDMSGQVVENVKTLGLQAVIIIGGDGTLSIAQELYLKNVPVVGIPKTIDNDISATDVTFGFDTAVNTATDALDRLRTTAESHHRVMLLEVMGREAGWIALESGLSGGADVIVIPEIPYQIDKICAFIKERKRSGKRFSIVVAAEGAKPVGGTVTVKEIVSDPTQPVRLGGVGNKIGQQIEQLTGIETRVTILGHIQRGGSPTAFDRILSTRFGATAVDLAVQRQFGQMVCLKNTHIRHVSIAEAVGKQRLVPLDSDLITTARQIGVCFGD